VTLFAHVLTAGLVMAVIALSGALTLLLSTRTVQRLITPLVAFAAGTLLGGALLHLQPAALTAGLDPAGVGLYTLAGFVLFLLLERIVQRHQHHRAAGGPLPLTYLILLGDGVHNFLGGLAIGAAFVADIRAVLTGRGCRPDDSPADQEEQDTRQPYSLPVATARTMSVVEMTPTTRSSVVTKRRWTPV